MPHWGNSRRKVGKGKKILLVVILVSIIFYFIFWYIESRLEPILTEMSVARIKQIATSSVNESISKEIAQKTDFKDLIQFEADNEGKIRAATFNYSKFAEIVSSSTTCIEDTLNDLENYKETIKLGAVFNSSILANVGPNIPITVVPVGSVKVNPRAEYQNAGINVVIMTVVIDVSTELKVVIPFTSEPTVLETTIPIVQAQIFGEVPKFYFESQGSSPSNGTNNVYFPPVQIIESEDSDDATTEKDNSIQTAINEAGSMPGFEEFYPVISN